MKAARRAMVQNPVTDDADRRWQIDALKALELAGPELDTQKRKIAMVFLYRKGYSCPRIGKLFNVSRQRVHSVIGDSIGEGYLQSIEDERLDLALRSIPLLRTGKSQAEVAQRLDIDLAEIKAMVMAARKAVSRGRAAAWAVALIKAMDSGVEAREKWHLDALAKIAKAIKSSRKDLRLIAKESSLAYSSVHELATYRGGAPRWFPSPRVLRRLAISLPGIHSLMDA